MLRDRPSVDENVAAAVVLLTSTTVAADAPGFDFDWVTIGDIGISAA